MAVTSAITLLGSVLKALGDREGLLKMRSRHPISADANSVLVSSPVNCPFVSDWATL